MTHDPGVQQPPDSSGSPPTAKFWNPTGVTIHLCGMSTCDDGTQPRC